jgi:hypothetical protein
MTYLEAPRKGDCGGDKDRRDAQKIWAFLPKLEKYARYVHVN